MEQEECCLTRDDWLRNRPPSSQPLSHRERGRGEGDRPTGSLAGSLGVDFGGRGIVGILVVLPMINVFYKHWPGVPAYWYYLFGNADTRQAIMLTLIVAPVAVLANMIFGIAAAWTIAPLSLSGPYLLTTLIDLPFSVSPVVAGLLFVLIFGLQGYYRVSGWIGIDLRSFSPCQDWSWRLPS